MLNKQAQMHNSDGHALSLEGLLNYITIIVHNHNTTYYYLPQHITHHLPSSTTTYHRLTSSNTAYHQLSSSNMAYHQISSTTNHIISPTTIIYHSIFPPTIITAYQNQWCGLGIYSFDGEIYRQENGGAIGNSLTGALASCFMVVWARIFKEKLVFATQNIKDFELYLLGSNPQCLLYLFQEKPYIRRLKKKKKSVK